MYKTSNTENVTRQPLRLEKLSPKSIYFANSKDTAADVLCQNQYNMNE